MGGRERERKGGREGGERGREGGGREEREEGREEGEGTIQTKNCSTYCFR